MVQQDTDQFSLRALQFASPQFIDIVSSREKCQVDKFHLAWLNDLSLFNTHLLRILFEPLFCAGLQCSVQHGQQLSRPVRYALLKLLLSCQNTCFHPVRDDPPVSLGIVFQSWPQNFPYLFRCHLWNHKLCPIQTPGRVHLTGKCGIEWSGPQSGDERRGGDVHRGQLRVRQ